MDIQQKVTELVEQHRLNQPNYEFNRDNLIKSLGDSLEALLLAQAKFREAKGKEGYIYPEFKNATVKLRAVFDALSMVRKTTTGKTISEGVWLCFFAKYVATRRKALFPDIQQKIESAKIEKEHNMKLLKINKHD